MKRGETAHPLGSDVLKTERNPAKTHEIQINSVKFNEIQCNSTKTDEMFDEHFEISAPERDVVPEQLHDQCGLLRTVFPQVVDLPDGIFEGLEETSSQEIFSYDL